MLNDKYKAKGLDTLGPFGVPCSEDQAREWETKLRDWEKEELGFKRATLYKSQPEEFVEGEMADISIINDLSLDRDGEIVLPKGGNFDQFLKYSPITLNHNYEAPPIGRAAWVKPLPNKRTATAIKMKALYAPRPNDYPEGVEWQPEKIYALIKGGYLSGKSIGFIAESARAVTQKEVDERPELANCKRIIDKWTLLECAVATIPCNPAALTEAVSKGIVQKSLLDSLGIPVELQEPEDAFVNCWDWEETMLERAKQFVKPAALAKPAYAKRWTDVARQLSKRLSVIDEATILARLRGKP